MQQLGSGPQIQMQARPRAKSIRVLLCLLSAFPVVTRVVISCEALDSFSSY